MAKQQRYSTFHTSSRNYESPCRLVRENADCSTLIGCHGNVPWKIKKAQWVDEQAVTPVYKSWTFGEDRSIRLWATGSQKSTIKKINKEKPSAKYVALLVSLPSGLNKVICQQLQHFSCLPVAHNCLVFWLLRAFNTVVLINVTWLLWSNLRQYQGNTSTGIISDQWKSSSKSKT